MKYNLDLVFPIADIHKAYILKENNIRVGYVDLICVANNRVVSTKHEREIEELEYRCDRLNAEAELARMGIYSKSPYWKSWESTRKLRKMEMKIKRDWLFLKSMLLKVEWRV